MAFYFVLITNLLDLLCWKFLMIAMIQSVSFRHSIPVSPGRVTVARVITELQHDVW